MLREILIYVGQLMLMTLKYQRILSPIQTRLFLVFWDRGGGRIPPPPLNSDNIKAMTTKLKTQIVSPKMFPLRSATSGDDVI